MNFHEMSINFTIVPLCKYKFTIKERAVINEWLSGHKAITSIPYLFKNLPPIVVSQRSKFGDMVEKCRHCRLDFRFDLLLLLLFVSNLTSPRQTNCRKNIIEWTGLLLICGLLTAILIAISVTKANIRLQSKENSEFRFKRSMLALM